MMMLNLVSQIALPITQDQKRRLNRIDAEDYSFIVEKVREELMCRDEEVCKKNFFDHGVNALKQYYALALLDPANAHAISADLDPFWHMHIFCTEQYISFCNDVMGEYMHHVPLDKSDIDKVKNVTQLYKYSLFIMSRIFKEPDPVFWNRNFRNEDVICMHKGNQEIYLSVQNDRLFEPCEEGSSWAYS